MTGTDVFHITYVEPQVGENVNLRVRVTHLSGWRLEHTVGGRCADIYTPAGSCVDVVQVTEWEWDPPEGGPSRADGPNPGPDELGRALVEWVTEYADDLNLPGIEP